MTTEVVVRANHGWPVEVNFWDKDYTTNQWSQHTPSEIVHPNTERTFFVWDGHDIFVHEVQPEELKEEV
ncbi:MAG: hypothetical protein P4L79_10590 [Legionella sp.]|uniref:hypothetical protein n=1 Tax=Legionella sp. TaxID=459 RepID=UPI00283CCAFC|nr:hypothetical protein [Legionella sp.]